MDNKVLLKWFLLLGGVLELFVGVIFFFIDGLILTLFGLTTLSIFTDMNGIFFICFGILLILASKDTERYLACREWYYEESMSYDNKQPEAEDYSQRMCDDRWSWWNYEVFGRKFFSKF